MVSRNPYLLVHRTYHKRDIRPLIDLEVEEKKFHLWPENRPLRKSRLMKNLRRAEAFENSKRLWNGYQNQKHMESLFQQREEENKRRQDAANSAGGIRRASGSDDDLHIAHSDDGAPD